VNNAGILRDKSMKNVEEDDWDLVISVHLKGTYCCAKPMFLHLRDRGEGGVIINTSSTSGLIGNFGQTNYGAAKMGIVGFMNSLALEGNKYNIKVNSLAPIAATRMTEDLMPPKVLSLLQPEAVTPAVIFMASEAAPTRQIIAAGAGVFAKVVVQETPGVFLPSEIRDAEHVASAWEQIADTNGQSELSAGGDQTMKFLAKAASELGIELG
jgi:hypothetical protein